MAGRIHNYYLGCPIWANKEWVGSLFTQNAKPKDYLRQYAAVFNLEIFCFFGQKFNYIGVTFIQDV